MGKEGRASSINTAFKENLAEQAEQAQLKAAWHHKTAGRAKTFTGKSVTDKQGRILLNPNEH